MSIRETLLARALYNIGRSQSALEWMRNQLVREVSASYFDEDLPESLAVIQAIERALPEAQAVILEALALSNEDSLKNHVLDMIAKGYISRPSTPGTSAMKAWEELLRLLEEK
jgi:hypothetical protein